MRAQEFRETAWRSPRDEWLPDFIIGGAMKCGTTTIHDVLAQHPDVFIPDFEIGFFNIDDLRERDVNYFDPSSTNWTTQDMSLDRDRMWRWYRKWFEPAAGRLAGEDSATYLASPIAARRIALQTKPIKLIFSLRQPSERVYSHYYHLLRRGRAMFDFEDMLRFQSKLLIDRSLYTEQLRAFFDVIEAARIHVVLFDDLVERPADVYRGLCEFLDLDFERLPEAAMNIHGNRKPRERFVRPRIVANRLTRRRADIPDAGAVPFEPPASALPGRGWAKTVSALQRAVNPRTDERAPPMHADTRRLLDRYFRQRLDGLDELLGCAVLDRWFAPPGA